MRITNKMITDQVITNLSRGIDRFMKLETMMSSGRRINKASDDPIGTIRDLGYRSRIAQLEQYESNISHAKSWLTHVDLAIGDINNLLIDAKAIAVQLANDNYDATAREAAANEVESIFEQILQSGNTELGGRYLFSGQETLTKAFISTSVGVVYQGDSGRIDVDIEPSSRMSINTVGSDLLTAPFRALGEDADLDPGIELTTLLSDLNGGNGVDLSTGIIKITDLNLGITVDVDISGAVTIGDVINEINTQLPGSPPNDITNLTVELGLDGNNLRLISSARNAVSLVTPLGNLNEGMGMDLDPPKFIIHNSDSSIEVTVDLAGCTTLGDVVNAINTTLASHPDPQMANVTASINAAGTGLQIQDTNGVPLALIVSEYEQDNTTASDLGLSGNIGSLLVGEDLNPEPQFKVEENVPGETTAEDLGLLGQFKLELSGGDVDPVLKGDTLISQLNRGLGVDLDTITINHGDQFQRFIYNSCNQL
jgi:flagellar hook-associated protein 3 FlgL